MPQLILRSTDLETSGLEPPEAEIIEIGWTDVLWDTETRTGTIGATKSMLFAPTKPLEPANVAIHHLTNRMLSAYPVCDESDVRDMVRCGSDLLLGEPIYAFVAHNAAFENKWFTPEILGDVKTICTMKCAARLERESPTISNQGLRYYFDMDLAEEDAMPPHRAGPDSYVTAHILLKLL
ncbi:MAG: 3'-5' exonuclease, partial [Alphaproteobacteria bacterium]|nr:3'-5' exonuclease [Alphaproteobacteria bacterium]